MSDVPAWLLAFSADWPDLLDVAETARILRRSTHYVRQRVAAGELVAFQPGKRGEIRVPRSALVDYLRRQVTRQS